MKSTEAFKQTISQELTRMAEMDPLFAESMKKEGKNIDDCITYILNQVQKSGCNGFTDDEIFGMAAHYYDEDKIEVGKPISTGSVVVNHHVELTPEEIEEAKAKGREEAIEEVKRREKLKATSEGKKQLPGKIKLSPAEKEEAKKRAYDQVLEEERARLKAKKTPKKEDPKVEQPTLF